jgi:Transglycosylase SLT domain
MYFSGESIFIILLAGLVVGLLPSAIVQRTGFRLICDIAIGIVGVFIGGWLIFASRDFVPATTDLPPGKSMENINAGPAPRCEAVVPLTLLRPLLKPVIHRSRKEICDALTKTAHSNDLPAHFFIRLLYQESSFKAGAISSAGALGIAQFMPETSTDRGLDNPFDPLQAIPASARLLHDLHKRFGNLGLAAAAYNAGARRVADWLANKGQLPQETQDYVNAITGWPAETWKTLALGGSPAVKLPKAAPCQEAAGLLAWNGPDRIPLPPRNPRVQHLADHVTAARGSGGLRSKTLHAKSQAAKREQGTKTTDLAGE